MDMFTELHLMDKEIALKEKQGIPIAILELNSLSKATNLARLLIARNAYEYVTMTQDWFCDSGYRFIVTVCLRKED